MSYGKKDHLYVMGKGRDLGKVGNWCGAHCWQAVEGRLEATCPDSASDLHSTVTQMKSFLKITELKTILFLLNQTLCKYN